MTAPEYTRARTVLLDALEALDEHRDAVVLVGAQAVYLHTGDADFVTAPTTTDADLVLTPDALAGREPAIEDAMVAAGFVCGTEPGMWFGRGRIAVDLLVPEGVSGPGGRRAARLPDPHGKRAARKTPGLEPALVDNEVHVLHAFDDDARSFSLKVAGPAALLVAKVVKVAERRVRPARLKPKDGLDILRLLRATTASQLGDSLVELRANPLSGAVVEQALVDLRLLAQDPDGLLPSLAAKAEERFEDPDVLRMSMVLLAGDVLDAVGAGQS